MKVFSNLSQIQEKIKSLREELKSVVPTEDLPTIERLSLKGAFTMKLSDLNKGILSPYHYDLLHQADVLKAVINTCSADQIETKLREILRTSKILITKPVYITSGEGKDMILHPVFVKKCRRAFEIIKHQNSRKVKD